MDSLCLGTIVHLWWWNEILFILETNGSSGYLCVYLERR
jgi:hypothetical protein